MDWKFFLNTDFWNILQSKFHKFFTLKKLTPKTTSKKVTLKTLDILKIKIFYVLIYKGKWDKVSLHLKLKAVRRKVEENQFNLE